MSNYSSWYDAIQAIELSFTCWKCGEKENLKDSWTIRHQGDIRVCISCKLDLEK